VQIAANKLDDETIARRAAKLPKEKEGCLEGGSADRGSNKSDVEIQILKNNFNNF